MTWNPRVRIVMLLTWFSVCCAVAGSAHAQPFDIAALQRLLQDAPKHELRFTESRESPWLAAPVQTSGRMRTSATMLEKEVEQPRHETWRILNDRMQVVTAGSDRPKEILFANAPAVAALGNALRFAAAGDLRALERDFQLKLGGDERVWTLQLTPRRSEVARYVKQLELQGTQGSLQVIDILEAKGERTTTRLIPNK